MTEKKLQQCVTDLAALMGWLTYHTHDSRRSQPGFPDLTLVRDGRLIFVELKSAKGRLTPEQIGWLKVLGETPADVYVWRPCDWDSGEIEEVLR